MSVLDQYLSRKRATVALDEVHHSVYYTVCSSCFTLLASADFAGGSLGRARVVSRRGLLFPFFCRITVPISNVYSYVDLPICLSSSAGSVGTYLASQSSHLNNASVHYLPASLIFLFYNHGTGMFLGEPYFSSFFFFYGPLFWYHVRACCRRASDFLLVEVPQAQHSATISPHRAAKQVRADQSATTQASRHTLLQYRKHSTKQRNQPAQSRKASTCRSECDNASKQAELARPSTCMSSMYTAR